MELPQKIKNETASWLNDSTSGNISEETQNTDLKEYMHFYVHCSIIYNSQDLEAARVSISGGVDKMSVVYSSIIPIIQFEYHLFPARTLTNTHDQNV